MKLKIFESLGITSNEYGTYAGTQPVVHETNPLLSFSPVDGLALGTVFQSRAEDTESALRLACTAFGEWRKTPAPVRGDIVRQLADSFRLHKEPLGELVSYEMGKSLQEGYGEVQELIDICDFATGLSRQLYGMNTHSERPGHRLYEQWHPLGVVGIITAFNFPVAVWSWNFMLSLVCGNTCVWKPSEKTPFTSIACHKIVSEVFRKNNVPQGVANLLIGGKETGEKLAEDSRVCLLSATGSTAMGKHVSQKVAARMGKYLLELGGNNAIIVSRQADLSIAVPAVVFGAVGTAGQRCTTTRRLIVEESIYEVMKQGLAKAYRQIKIGDPLNPENHMGPLIDKEAVQNYLAAIESCKREGGSFLIEGKILQGQGFESGCYVAPCIAEVNPNFEIVCQETFAPILYLMKYRTLEEALHIQNNVPQGLSSSIMTENLKEAETFLSASGSDCGIANVNIGTSGAEIGGAFGGEKDTGGGRESGSDAWKSYMRRQTVTINYSDQLPLAQGINFNLG